MFKKIKKIIILFVLINIIQFCKKQTNTDDCKTNNIAINDNVTEIEKAELQEKNIIKNNDNIDQMNDLTKKIKNIEILVNSKKDESNTQINNNDTLNENKQTNKDSGKGSKTESISNKETIPIDEEENSAKDANSQISVSNNINNQKSIEDSCISKCSNEEKINCNSCDDIQQDECSSEQSSCNKLEINRYKSKELNDECKEPKDCNPELEDKCCNPNPCIVKTCKEIKPQKCIDEEFPYTCKTKTLCDLDYKIQQSNNFVLNPQRSLFAAKLLGAAANNCPNDKFSQIHIDYTPYKSKYILKLKGIINQAKRCAKKHSDACEFGLKWKDRIAVLSFGCDGKSFKWCNPVPSRIKSVCDYRKYQLNKCKDPKIKLEMIQEIRYVRKPKDDEQTYSNYAYDKDSLELIESMEGAKKISKNKEIYEKTIKSFIYACPIYCGCNYASSKWRDRDAFIFVGRDSCGNGEMPFKEIHKLMKKGHKSPEGKGRLIKMSKCGSKKSCQITVAVVTFGWKLTIVYKNKDQKECFLIQKLGVEKTFF